MTAIAISEAALAAITSTPLLLGSAGYENETNERGERLIWLDHAGDRPLRGLCAGPGESYGGTILRPAANAASNRQRSGEMNRILAAALARSLGATPAHGDDSASPSSPHGSSSTKTAVAAQATTRKR